jgi:inner membrane protein
MALILAGLYGFLYMTLKAETYALLAGALGLWVALAVIMYLTRRIDWYAQGGSLPTTRTNG